MADTLINGLIIHIKTMNENLDIRTFVYADVYMGDEKLAENIQVAAGEVEEWQDHAPVSIPLKREAANPTNLFIELRHPGIDSNADPHWRMRFSLEATTRDGQRRSCNISMQSSPIYDGAHGGHLNFEGGNRNSGRMPFSINF